MRVQTALVAGVGVLVIAAVLYVWRKGAGAVAQGAVNLVNDTVGGAVVGVGNVIGIPETNLNECDRALAEGRYWDASFVCPAGRLVKGLFGDVPSAIPAEPTSAVPSSTGTAAPSVFSEAPIL